MFKHTLPAFAAALLLSTSALAASPQLHASHAPPPIAKRIGDSDISLELKLQVPLTETVLDSKVYCPKEPKALWCVGDDGADNKLTMAQVQQADVMLRAVYKEEVDEATEKAGAYWRESTTGDCKTYALTLAQRLHALGESGQDMALMMSLPDPYEAHMTLLVQTSDAGMVEVGDEDGGEPHKFDLDEWVRTGFSPFDGQQLWYLMVSQEEVALKFEMNEITHLVVNELPKPKVAVPAKPLKMAAPPVLVVPKP